MGVRAYRLFRHGPWQSRPLSLWFSHCTRYSLRMPTLLFCRLFAGLQSDFVQSKLFRGTHLVLVGQYRPLPKPDVKSRTSKDGPAEFAARVPSTRERGEVVGDERKTTLFSDGDMAVQKTLAARFLNVAKFRIICQRARWLAALGAAQDRFRPDQA